MPAVGQTPAVSPAASDPATSVTAPSPTGPAKPAETVAEAEPPSPNGTPTADAEATPATTPLRAEPTPATTPLRAEPTPATTPLGALDVETQAVPVGAPPVRYAAGSARVQPGAARGRRGAGSSRVPHDAPQDPWAGSAPHADAIISPTRQWSGVPEPAEPIRRRGRRGWIAAAIVVILAIAGGTVAYLRLRPHEVTAAHVVQHYFDDLSAGDTAGAMALVQDASTYQGPNYPLLTASVLGRADSRPSHVSIGTPGATTTGDGKDALAVPVTYTAGISTVHQTVTAVKGDATHPYLLNAPFVSVSVGGATAGRPLTVNGIPYPEGSASTRAFPGAYTATVAASLLLAGVTSAATYDSSDGLVDATITVPVPQAATGAQAAVQAAVNAALDACAASTSATPVNNCPFRYQNAGATMKWTMVTYPVVALAVGADGAVTFTDTGHPATVHYDATTSGFLGISSTDSNDATVDVSGTAAIGASGVTVALAAPTN